MKTESILLTKAVDALYKNTGLHLEVLKAEFPAADRRLDALVVLKTDGITRTFAVECKRRIQRDMIGAVIHYLRTLPEKGLLVADYVNPVVADQLTELGIPFIDTAGNAYLNEPPVFVYIRGRRLAQRVPGKELRGAAFRPSGLKIVFAFLCDPGLVNAPFRKIAERAGVALGTIGWVMRDLRALGFLVEMGKQGRRLAAREGVVKEWTACYPAVLRPKLHIGRYTAQDPGFWATAQLGKGGAYWGGEVAAAKLTKYLKPAVTTIYTLDNPAKLIVQNRLREDRDGQVEILKAFWGTELLPRGEAYVPPVLVYADLLASGNPRNLETAKIIYDREITGFIEQD